MKDEDFTGQINLLTKLAYKKNLDEIFKYITPYFRKVGLYPELFDWKNCTDSKKYLPQILQYGSSLQILVYIGYMGNSNTLPVNSEADEESDCSLDDRSGEDSDDDHDEEDDHQNSGIVQQAIHRLFVPLVRHEELHDPDISMEGENQQQNTVGDNFQRLMVLPNQAEHQNDVIEVNAEGRCIVPDNQDNDIAENIVAMPEVANVKAAEMPVWENENALMDQNVSATARFVPVADDIPEGDHLNIENFVANHIDVHQFDVEEDFQNNFITNENIDLHDIN